MKFLDIPKVKGHRILLEIQKPKDLPESTTIVIPDAVMDRRIQGSDFGKVVEIGPDAFIHRHATEPYCVPGDYVLYVQYAGIQFIHPDTKKVYRIINEEDLVAIIGENNT